MCMSGAMMARLARRQAQYDWPTSGAPKEPNADDVAKGGFEGWKASLVTDSWAPREVALFFEVHALVAAVQTAAPLTVAPTATLIKARPPMHTVPQVCSVCSDRADAFMAAFHRCHVQHPSCLSCARGWYRSAINSGKIPGLQCVRGCSLTKVDNYDVIELLLRLDIDALFRRVSRVPEATAAARAERNPADKLRRVSLDTAPPSESAGSDSNSDAAVGSPPESPKRDKADNNSKDEKQPEVVEVGPRNMPRPMPVTGPAARLPARLEKQSALLDAADLPDGVAGYYLWRKYQARCLDRALLVLPGFQYCPNSRCGTGFTIENVDPAPGQEGPSQDCRSVACPECATAFCYHCRGDAHPTLTCEEHHNRAAGTTINTYYIQRKYTRPCPQCGVAIEKNGGCPQVTCTGCRKTFCFMCKKDYVGGNSHSNCSAMNDAFIRTVRLEQARDIELVRQHGLRQAANRLRKVRQQRHAKRAKGKRKHAANK